MKNINQKLSKSVKKEAKIQNKEEIGTWGNYEEKGRKTYDFSTRILALAMHFTKPRRGLPRCGILTIADTMKLFELTCFSLFNTSFCHFLKGFQILRLRMIAKAIFSAF